MAAEHSRCPLFDKPSQPRPRNKIAQGTKHGQPVDDVAHGAQANDENVGHGRGLVGVRIVVFRTAKERPFAERKATMSWAG